MLHAIVFDFDGVIADSERLHLRAYQEVLEPQGIELSERDYYDRYLGYDATLPSSSATAAMRPGSRRWIGRAAACGVQRSQPRRRWCRNTSTGPRAPWA